MISSFVYLCTLVFEKTHLDLITCQKTHYLFKVAKEPIGLWKSQSVKKRKLVLFTNCFTREFPSLNLQVGGEQGEEMANDGDLGLAFRNFGSGVRLFEEEVDWNQGCNT